jgi:biopolymer transport protein ExbD|tara:strand:+ start:4148 stop:4546 length:399 start_codon:yes stop_codon:yes gene_type:complete
VKSIQRQRRPSIRMELSPLIDCIFQLLIFFMLSSTFLTPAIQLTLPSATAGTSQNELEIIITLSKEGDVYLNNTKTSLISLKSELQRMLTESNHKSVTIRGDQNMPYSAFLDALDIAKRSGAVHVNVAHQTP